MKEQYVKPLIFFESYSLTQTIARDCGDTHTGTLGESTHYNERTCEWDLGGGFTLFLEAPRCEIEMEEDDEIEGVCYNNPDGGRQVFSSM